MVALSELILVDKNGRGEQEEDVEVHDGSVRKGSVRVVCVIIWRPYGDERRNVMCESLAFERPSPA